MCHSFRECVPQLTVYAICSISGKLEQSQFVYIIVDVTFIIVFMIISFRIQIWLGVCVSCADSQIISVSEVIVTLYQLEGRLYPLQDQERRYLRAGKLPSLYERRDKIVMFSLVLCYLIYYIYYIIVGMYIYSLCSILGALCYQLFRNGDFLLFSIFF